MDQSELSFECAGRSHGRCTHRNGSGGGLNLRRLRFEWGSVLCACHCHSRCPLAGHYAVTPTEWAQSCTCEGGRQAREEFEPPHGSKHPNFSDFLRGKRGRARQSNEGGTTSKDGARGATLLGEFDGVVKGFSELFRGIKKITDPAGRDIYSARPGSVPPVVEVLLDAGADRLIESNLNIREPPTGQAEGAPRHEDRPGYLVPVRLESTGGEPGEASINHTEISAYIELDRIGKLDAKDSRALAIELAAAKQKNMSMMMPGVYSKAGPNKGARLVIYPAGMPRS